MRKIYPFIFLLMTLAATGQIINFPDPVFKNVLVNTICATPSGEPSPVMDVDSNDDGEIQVSEAAAVSALFIQGNGITSIEGIEYFSSLMRLNCSNNLIETIDLSESGSSYFLSVNVSSNPLTSLLFPSVVIKDMYASFTNLTTLDLNYSTGSNGSSIEINNNSLLESINAKNGSFEDSAYMDGIFVQNNPVLQYICTDDYSDFLMPWQTEFSSWVNAIGIDPNVMITTYCNFAPGGEYNMLNGSINMDCGGSNIPIPNVILTVTQGLSSGTTNTSFLGNYFFYAANGPITVTPQLNTAIYTVSPPSFTYDFTTSGNVIEANFCITPNGNHSDVEVSILEVTPARPGFDAEYKIIVRNVGTVTESGTANFNYEDAILDFVSATPTEASSGVGMLSWNFADLAPWESMEYTCILNVNSPMETPPINIGDVLNISATASIINADESLLNNNYQFNQTVIGSYDPNDKAVQQQQITTLQTDDYLNYIVRFQNTGTYFAQNVVVKDMLSEMLDYSTLEIISASHPYRATLTESNKLEVFFENILLPAVADDEPGSHGYVAFKIKPNSTVGLGDVIENTANIYFDFNFPIVTNTVATTVTQLGVAENEITDIKIYPNPAQSLITIQAKTHEEIPNVSIYNLLGQQVNHILNNIQEGNIAIDISNLKSGTYFVEIVSTAGKTTKKFVKI